VLPASGDQPAKLCIHYRPEVLSLGRIKEIAEGTGAQLTKRFGHILWETGGLSSERRARTVTEHLQRVTGVMEAVVTLIEKSAIECIHCCVTAPLSWQLTIGTAGVAMHRLLVCLE
jgi:Zn2+/Cd2+-exporting ATPase